MEGPLTLNQSGVGSSPTPRSSVRYLGLWSEFVKKVRERMRIQGVTDEDLYEAFSRDINPLTITNGRAHNG